MCTGGLLALAAAGSAIEMGAEIASGENAYRQAKRNREVAQADARQEIQRGKYQALEIRREGRAIAGRQRVGQAAGGVDVQQGTAAEIIANTDILSAEDAARARNNALLRSFSIKEASDREVQAAKLGRRASYLNAAATGITSGVDLYRNSGSLLGGKGSKAGLYG